MLKAHVHPRCIARPVLQLKTFRVVENRCLQCVKSIFVNLPQFAKSGLKESLNRFFWYFSLHLFGYFGLVSSLFVSVSVCFHCSSFDGGAIETYGWKPASTEFAEVHSSPWIRFLNLWRDWKEALGCKNSTDSVFAELLRRMFNCKQTKVPMKSVERKTSESI